jgi:hypothetical protein
MQAQSANLGLDQRRPWKWLVARLNTPHIDRSVALTKDPADCRRPCIHHGGGPDTGPGHHHLDRSAT